MVKRNQQDLERGLMSAIVDDTQKHLRACRDRCKDYSGAEKKGLKEASDKQISGPLTGRQAG